MKRCKIVIYSFLTIFIFNTSSIIPQDNQIQLLLDSLSIDNIRTHIDSLCWAGGYQTRAGFTDGNSEAANYIYNYFKSLPGITKAELDIFLVKNSLYPYSTYPQFNVIATIEGKAVDPQIILMGGHYDASGSREDGYNSNWKTFTAQGADDNATGVASIMEIARVLSDTSINFNNKHTFKFIAFGSEEYHPVHSSAHHVGSLFDAEKMAESNEPLSAAIILDMIGYNPKYNYTEVISNDQSLWLADHIYNNRDIYIPNLKTNSTPADVPYSDHQSYQDYGFSAILLMENDKPWNNDSPYYTANPYYHTSNDSVGTLNFTLVEMVAGLALAGAATLSIKDDPTSINDEVKISDNLPIDFSISAYPNPFNGRVNILISIEKNERINIFIYNSLGQKIESLFHNREFFRGNNHISWDAANQPSGIYYFVIQTATAAKSQKLMLIK